jgi:DNA-directed RNA polymerase II subunit RPB1
MSDETCRLVGLSPENARPEHMIITVLPVPPQCVRPTVCMDNNSSKGEDDLTHVLSSIIKHNNALNKKDLKSISAIEHKRDLQFYISSYIDSDLAGQKNSQKGSRPIKSLRHRLKGKEGRIRNNLMGKR